MHYTFQGYRILVIGKRKFGTCGWAVQIKFDDNSISFVFLETFESETGEKLKMSEIEEI